MLIINMLIPDLLNILFDQCNYDYMTTLRSLNKRKTNYANKYSLLRYYNLPTNRLRLRSIHEYEDIKTIKHTIPHTSSRVIQDALIWSASCGRVLAVKYLVSVGANIHSHNDYALRQSAEFGHLEVVKYLISVGANVRACGDCALIASAANGHLETIKYLVSIGANVNASNDLALRWSADCEHLEIVKYLISVGANIRVNNDELFDIKIIKDN